MRLLLACLLLFAASPAFALQLGQPIACEVGKECFVQNYVDASPGSGWGDYTCQKLSYDKHDGTDIRLKDYVQMRKGVDVLAAAAGTVAALRDGMEDINVNKIDRQSIMKSGCGNAVILDHGDGWQTMYCHMKKGSVAVKQGDAVKAGQKLGQVGLSGLTEFPHLHIAVKKDGTPVDPFTGKGMESPCDSIEPVTPLWNTDAMAKLAYLPSAILGIDFTKEKPDQESALEGKHSLAAFTPESPAIVLWTLVMGAQTGDTLLMQIFDPAENVVQIYQKDFEKPQATFFAYTGKTNANIGKWPEGIYKGKVTLLRKVGDTRKAYLTDEREIYVR